MDNNVQIIKLLQEKIDTMHVYFTNALLLQSMELRAEISMHRRDEHLKYWDHTTYCEDAHKQRDKVNDLHKEMEEIDKKITESMKVSLENPVYNCEDFFDGMTSH